MQLQDIIDVIRVDFFFPMEISLNKMYFRYILLELELELELNDKATL